MRLPMEAPRLFVTDREFCGAYDSPQQLMRLLKLEEEGEVTVYKSYAEFQKEFPPVKQAA